MVASVLSTAEEEGFLLVEDTVALVAAVLSTEEEELVQLCFLSRLGAATILTSWGRRGLGPGFLFFIFRVSHNET